MDTSDDDRAGAGTGLEELLREAIERDGSRLAEFSGACVGSRAEADVLVAEAFAAAFSRAGAGDTDALSTVGLFSELRRKCARAWERRRTSGGSRDAVDPGSRAQKLLLELRPTEREALLLRYVGDLGFDAVARVCEIERTAAVRRVSAALYELCRAARPGAVLSESPDPRLASVLEHLSEIVDGTASTEVADAVAADDVARDLVHDAERIVELVRGIEADHVIDAGSLLEETLRRASAVKNSEPTPVAPAPAAVPTPAAPAPAAVPAPAAPAPPAPAPAALRVGVRARVAIVAAAVVVVGSIALFSRGSRDFGDDRAAWSGTVGDVSHSFGDENGLERCSPDGAVCSKVGSGDDVPAGSILKTDAATRVEVLLKDGSRFLVDRSTEISFDGNFARRAHLGHGSVVADFSDRSAGQVRIDAPLGHVETSSAKFSLSVSPRRTAVAVVRGSVRLADAEDHTAIVRSGEEGSLEPGAPPEVSSTAYFGNSLGWTERAFAKSEAADSVGLGELRAKKPGEDRERERVITLASHSTRVRIVGSVARTEVEEVFANDSDDVLEGIYRFPLPPDAEIERLALDVDGKIEEGAFVDRERAAAIWRGAIVNSGAKKPIGEEIVWVPGPWRDPALLEWQRGGRFELHVYPIPKHGSRRVIVAYTQTIRPSGSLRTYQYPLSHDPSGKLRIGTFDVDVEVRGYETKAGVVARGYPFQGTALTGGVESLHFHADRFVPAGDIAIDYSLPNPDQEVTAWAYEPSPDEVLAERGSPAPPDPANAGVPASSSGGDLAGDGFVAVALRPKLPRVADGARRSFAIAVDSSRSMFGERYRRASDLAVRLVLEMDRDDPVTVLACDSTCREIPGGAKNASAERARAVQAFLGAIVPEGGSDVTGAVKAARAVARADDTGALRIVYIGDGTPTIGAVTPAFVRREIEEAVPPDVGNVTAVAIGSDADVGTLGTLANSGGGVLVPYAPGQSVGEAAYAVLGATYGNALRDVRVDVPEGWEDASPRKLGAIPAGGEILLTGRLSRPTVSGTLVLRGKIGAAPFERRYPVRIEASTSKGNAFVPRLYAAARIADLELLPDAESRRRAIELSGRFHVASRYTSLLVLESAAMFKAFGVESEHGVASYTGEDDARSTGADGDDDDPSVAEGQSDKKDSLSELGAPSKAKSGGALDGFGSGFAGPAGGGGAERSRAPAPGEKREAAPGAEGLAADVERDAPEEAPAGRASSVAGPPAATRPAFAPPPEPEPRRNSALEITQPDDLGRDPLQIAPNTLPPPGHARRWIPMRKIWDRVGRIVVPAPSVPPEQIASAEWDARASDTSRDAMKRLYTLYFTGGDVDRASAVAERWSNKDPLDPDALTARADVAAARGQRDQAIRILGSVVDVRPGDHKAQWRLARLHRWAGRAELGCRHSMAVAQIRSTDAKLLTEAVRCARDVGQASVASDLLAAADDATRGRAATLLAGPSDDPNELRGDLQLEATWDGGYDLDLAMIHSEGRISWLGAPTRAVISARDVLSTSREGLALRGGSPGDYFVEVTRPSRSRGAVRGSVEIRAAGDRRTVPFVLYGDRVRVALIQVTTRPRLVPL